MIKEFIDTLKILVQEKNASGHLIPTDITDMCTRYLEEDATPDIFASIKLAKYFDCSLDYLFGVSKDKGSAPTFEFVAERFFDNYTTLLEENGLTHWRFAHSSTISESSARKWKKGTKPSMESLIKIAKLLNSSIDYLIG